MEYLLSINNLRKKDNKKLKAIADFLLYTLPLYLGAIMALPIPEGVKLYVNFAVTIIIVTAKGLTKFSSEQDAQEQNRIANEKLDDIKQQADGNTH